MNSSICFGTALSVVLLASVVSGCAGNTPKTASAMVGKINPSNIGLATRAQVALMAGQTVQAIDYAERAVAATPTDAGFRMVLGNSYFAGGRFASAEDAYRDSLTLLASQPQVVLKLALVSIAQGKNTQALAFLGAARSVLDPSDYGLALALAGRPQDAAQVLRQAAEQVGADSRVRQNLALALALSGDWTGARGVAAQDVAADQLDGRIQSWMQLARPTRVSDQVASLTGIAPAASDPGQPVRLALRDTGPRLAAMAPVAEPAPAISPVEVAAAVRIAVVTPAITPAPAVVAVPLPVEHREATFVHAPRAIVALAPKTAYLAPRPSLSPRAAALTDARVLFRPAALTTGGPRSRSVVQLGAFTSRDRVSSAWRNVSGHFTALRGYTPVAARYDGERGTFFRLSVQGFGSAHDAIAMCSGLKRAGATCFVRNVAGDAPVQFASR